jgi:iduronate 2-sulfatase
MKILLSVLVAVGVSSSAISAKQNILLICVDDLRPELNCFGVDYIHSPNIDALAARGRAFTRHYVQAPSCGPSRFTLLTGRYGPYGNDALVKRAGKRAASADAYPPSMPEWFRQHGYTTVSVGKVSHYPGGRAGTNWNDDAKKEMPDAWDRNLMPVGEWQHPEGAMFGLVNGEIRVKPGDMDVFQAAEGDDTIYPDGLIAREGLKQLDKLVEEGEPFFLAVGLIKPHLPFAAPRKYLDLYDGVELPPISHNEKPAAGWHNSGELMKYNRWGRDPRKDDAFAAEVRRHYAACVSYSDKHVGDFLARLKETGADKNTIVILWGDHGWHLGEHAIWGKHTLFEESLRSPLIVSYPGIKAPGVKSDAVVETLDIFPTLCDLTGVPVPGFGHGVSLLPNLKDPSVPGHPAISYMGTKTIRTDRYRLVLERNGGARLYDHGSSEKETVNIAAEQPDVVELLSKMISEKMKSTR